MWTTYGSIGDSGDTGDTGDDGEDGTGFQFIWRRTNSSTAPATPASDTDNDDDEPTDWDRVPQAIDAGEAYIYISTRTGMTGSWSVWSTPMLWAQYVTAGGIGSKGENGDDGDDGEDGDGVQLIWRRTNSATAPSTPSSSANQQADDDYIPTDWANAPQSVETDNRYVYVSRRIGTTMNWSAWSDPSLFAQFVQAGGIGMAGSDGNDGRWSKYSVHLPTDKHGSYPCYARFRPRQRRRYSNWQVGG